MNLLAIITSKVLQFNTYFFKNSPNKLGYSDTNKNHVMQNSSALLVSEYSGDYKEECLNDNQHLIS